MIRSKSYAIGLMGAVACIAALVPREMAAAPATAPSHPTGRQNGPPTPPAEGVFPPRHAAAALQIEAMRCAADESTLPPEVKETLRTRIRRAADELADSTARYTAGKLDIIGVVQWMEFTIGQLNGDAAQILLERAPAFWSRVDKTKSEAQMFCTPEVDRGLRTIESAVKLDDSQRARISAILKDAADKVKNIGKQNPPDAMDQRQAVGFATRAAVRRVLSAAQLTRWDGPSRVPDAAPSTGPSREAAPGALARGSGAPGAREPKLRTTLSGHRVGVISGLFSPDGKWLVTRAEKTLLWDLSSEKSTPLGEGPVDPLLFSGDGKLLILSRDIRTEIEVYDISSGRHSVRSLEKNPGEQFIAMSPDGKFEVVVVAGQVKLRAMAVAYDPATAMDAAVLTGASVRNVTLGNYPVSLTGSRLHPLQFTPDSRKLVILGNDGNFMIWDLATGKSITIPDSAGTSFAVSPDSKWMLAPGHREYHIYDLATGRSLGALESDRGRPASFIEFCFSPDGRSVASVSVYTIKLWSAANGRLIASFEKPKHSNEDWMSEVRFTPDGKYLIASAAHTFQFWDIAGRQATATLPMDVPASLKGISPAPPGANFGNGTNPNKFMAVSPDGSTIATSDNEDGTIRIWTMPRLQPKLDK